MGINHQALGQTGPGFAGTVRKKLDETWNPILL